MTDKIDLNIELPTTAGGTTNLSKQSRDFILFFYPKDLTSGCTTEAISFSEHLAVFQAAGYDVFGVSKDPMKQHDKFVQKHSLTMPLLSDSDTDLCERFDVWKEKSMYGKKYMGIERSTFVMSPDGTIAMEWRKVKVPGHVEAVLAHVKDT